MARLLQTHRMATVAQINNLYNHGEQNIISECMTCQSLRHMDHKSRRILGFYRNATIGTGSHIVDD